MLWANVKNDFLKFCALTAQSQGPAPTPSKMLDQLTDLDNITVSSSVSRTNSEDKCIVKGHGNTIYDKQKRVLKDIKVTSYSTSQILWHQ